MAKRIVFETLGSVTHEELKKAVIAVLKKKQKLPKDELHVHFRWGDPMDDIFATVDVIKEVHETND